MAPRARSRATIREWDRRAIEEIGIPGVALMENAGGGAAAIIDEHLGTRSGRPGRRFEILCGPGNNGGDGCVVARHLHNRGHDVHVHLAFDPWRLTESSDAAVQLRIVQRMGLAVSVPSTHPAPAPMCLTSPRDEFVVVDALLGTGLTRALGEPYSTWVDAANDCGRPIVALDLPTGLDADSGRVLGAACRASLTITFAAPKLGFTLRAGPSTCGDVHVVDIGLPREFLESPVDASPTESVDG